MFDLQRFIDDCLANAEDPGAVHELVAKAVSEPNALIQALGEPRQGGVQSLHVSEELTLLNVCWAPRMVLRPHNHEMWAVVGIYTGREDNIFWRRTPSATGSEIEAKAAKSLAAKDVTTLGKNIIHSVHNPVPRTTGALHVYGGNFFEKARSEWDPESLREQPYDIEANMRLFAEAKALAGSD